MVFAFAIVVFFHSCATDMDAIRAVPFFVRRNNHLIIFLPFTSIQSVSRGPNELFRNVSFFFCHHLFIDLESSNFIFRIYSIKANISHTLIRMCGKICNKVENRKVFHEWNIPNNTRSCVWYSSSVLWIKPSIIQP